jgi:hypothetical protein
MTRDCSYVEATGPWGRCNYLETTMMQAVYQVALRHHMRERKETYGQWLYEALFRCHLSMTFAKEQCRDMSGALFSGRRTGHHIFRMENGVCRDDEAPVRLLSLMTSARQDSGSLSEFKEVICGCGGVCACLCSLDSCRFWQIIKS